MPNNTMTGAVLVVGPSWVGDMVMAQSLFITLRRHDPDTVIDVVAPAWSVGLIGRMPEVRRAFTLDVGHGELGLVKRRRLGRRLRAEGYSRAIVLPRSFKAALVPWVARIPRRTGYWGEWRYGVLNDRRRMSAELDQTVKRFVHLGDGDIDDCPRPALTVDRENARASAEKLGLDIDRPAVGLMPGAEYGPAKQWPLRYYAELARCLADDGFQVWLLGSAREAGASGRIIELSGRPSVVSLCGKTSLTEAVDLIASLSAAVSNDSGLMHIAAAVRTPLVAIYGSSSPAYTPPLTDRARVIYLGVECSPCFQRNCPYGHYRCLNEISVRDVLGQVERSMGQSAEIRC